MGSSVQPGERYGRLLVVSFHCVNHHHHKCFLFRCDCGNEKIITGSSVRNGSIKSCGCLNRDRLRERALPGGEIATNQIINIYKQSARKYDRVCDLTTEQFKSLLESPCFYCGTVKYNTKKIPGHGSFGYNGIDRVDTNKGYTMDNVVPCCKVCNFAKNDMPQDDFFEWIRTSYLHLKQTNVIGDGVGYHSRFCA
jgi:hypothetical protein